MNNFVIMVKRYPDERTASDKVNEFIADCNKRNIEIMDMQTHFNSYDDDIEAARDYVFIFKIRKGVDN